MKNQSKKSYYRELVASRIQERQKVKKPVLCVWIPGKVHGMRYSFRVDPVGKNIEKYMVTFNVFKQRPAGRDSQIRNVFYLDSISYE